MRQKFFLTAVTVIGFAGMPAMAQNSQDVDFLKQAGSAGFVDVKIGEMAHLRGGTAELQQLGQSIADEARKSVGQVNTVLDHMGQAEVHGPDAAGKAEIDALARLPDTGFDGEFQRYVVDHHPQLIIAYQQEADDAGYEQARDVAKEGLPVLQNQLAMVKTLHKPLSSVAHQPVWARRTAPMGGDNGRIVPAKD
jgi:predicted outer membrane protein